ncbi:FAD dependent oxidoreductase [Xylariomycetidae sp. FL0641]|nr:FAD dependent oxidoreductase [Xylariomycetidae sp. FL0641]
MANPGMDKSAPILILGAGTFGLSTAYHLAKAGYSSITVVEKSATMPPRQSAGNDLNKIIRAEYEDPFYATLALAAMAAWKESPLFAPYYHEVGYLLATSSAAPAKARRSLATSLRSIQARPAFRGKITPLGDRAAIRRVAPAFDGPMAWTGYFNAHAGYAHAADALAATYAACRALGVRFALGQEVAALTYDDDARERRCTGAACASGARFAGATTILALGASLGAVLPRVGAQVAAKAWPVAHVRLAPAEARRLAGIPVTYARDLGFLFEPDPRTGLLKLCPAGAGYTRYASVPGAGAEPLSVAPADGGGGGSIPPRDERAVRRLLRETLPALADRPLVNCQLCWCADTADSEYIIDRVPGTRGLIVVSGDSAHAFKMLPVIGEWVMEVVRAGRQEKDRWRWKEGSRADGDVSWRVGSTTDLSDPSLGLGPQARL